MATEKKVAKTVSKKSKVASGAAAKKAGVASKVPAAKKSAKAQTVSGASVVSRKSGSGTEVSDRTGEDVFNRVQQEAYYLAEQDGFREDPVYYWLTAEVNLGLRSA